MPPTLAMPRPSALRAAALGALAALVLAGCDSGPPPATLFAAPMEGEAGVDWYYGALPDHSVEPNRVEDYECGGKAIEDRKATKLLIPSFRAMDRGVNVLAAWDGRVVEVTDGHYDRRLDYQEGRVGNRVRIRHPDGVESTYDNLKQGSITVSEGERVEAGQVIGQAGSSGDSAWPGVSFEARDGDGDLFDPWAGACSGSESAWVDQPGYPNQFTVVDYGTTDQPAILGVIAERPPDVTTFNRGQDLTFWVHTVNRPVGIITLRLFGPDAPLDSVAFNYLDPDPANTIYGGLLEILPDDPVGTWAIEYAMNGEPFARLEFDVTAAAPAAADAAGPDAAPRGRLPAELRIRAGTLPP